MRVPIGWLDRYCASGLAPRVLAERLSMTGTEVERVATRGVVDQSGFVLAEVITAEPHPNADRLRVCSVDVGEREPRTIVCGAPNVAAGQKVAVALPGAVMPNGTRLGKAKLRGVESSGMILSETELELGTDSGGIAVLDPDAGSAGTPLAEVLPISETVLELEITPNRPDCLGLYGVAREVHAITGAELAEAPWETDAGARGEQAAGDLASVRVEVPELCPRFTARIFTGVELGPSPLWLRARLLAAGQRPINNVVDITNYVMLLTGQPLHAFDLDRIRGGELVVRTAEPGERITTLDGIERELDPETVLVCDRDGPSGIAGIMGGQVSEVSESTTRILLEVATWDGTNILRTSNLLGLRSEASTRFEKQLHPELAIRAQVVASRLLVELCGARMAAGTIDADADLHPLRKLELSTDRCAELLGMEIPRDRIAVHLGRLGFGVEPLDHDRITVAVPPDRHFDVTREVDLIEEVARVHGLDQHLPATLPERGAGVGGLERHQALLRRLEDVLRDAGLDEAITWSFVPAERESRAVAVHNPLSEEQSRMRTDLVGGLLAVAAHNLARGAQRVALFESGRVYLQQRPPAAGGPLAGRFAGERGAPVAEPHRIGCVVVGALGAGSWRQQERPADFYDAKGLLELLAGGLGVDLTLEPATHPRLHPGRAATIRAGGEIVGWLGELHPRLLGELDAESGVAFELDVATPIASSDAGVEAFRDVTTHPAVLEDIAVVAPRELPAAQIEAVVREAGGPLLRSFRVFDVYEGEQVGEGKRSLALRLEFGADDRTLTDAEVAGRRGAIVEGLGRIGASLRG